MWEAPAPVQPPGTHSLAQGCPPRAARAGPLQPGTPRLAQITVRPEQEWDKVGDAFSLALFAAGKPPHHPWHIQKVMSTNGMQTFLWAGPVCAAPRLCMGSRVSPPYSLDGCAVKAV